MKTHLWLLVVVLLASSCRENNEISLVIEGQILDSRNNWGVSDVNVRLDEKVIEGGTLTSAFGTVTSVTTNADGYFRIEFPRKNALSYRLRLTKTGYFSNEFEINPDDVNSDAPYSTNLTIIPQAEIQVNLRNVSAESDADFMRFRKLNAFFECACCNNDFVNCYGASVDTSFTCTLFGDHNLSYIYTVYRSEVTEVVDSIFCPAFHTTELTIEY